MPRLVESTRTRSSGAIVLFIPSGGPPLPTLSEPIISVTVLAPTIGSRGTTTCPSGAAAPGSGLNSPGLLVLNGIAAASSCAPAIFAINTSGDCAEDAGSAGPLIVARLLRLPAVEGVLDEGRAGVLDEGRARFDLAICVLAWGRGKDRRESEHGLQECSPISSKSQVGRRKSVTSRKSVAIRKSRVASRSSFGDSYLATDS